jgi:hypothetical protein
MQQITDKVRIYTQSSLIVSTALLLLYKLYYINASIIDILDMCINIK